MQLLGEVLYSFIVGAVRCQGQETRTGLSSLPTNSEIVESVHCQSVGQDGGTAIAHCCLKSNLNVTGLVIYVYIPNSIQQNGLLTHLLTDVRAFKSVWPLGAERKHRNIPARTRISCGVAQSV